MRVPSSAAIAAVFVAAVALPAAAQPAPPASPPPLTYTQPLAPSGVLAVQQRLQQQGAYSGRIDGLWGPDSQSALERYQQTRGLQVTGQLNQATLATLGLPADQVLAAAPPGPAPAAPAAAAPISGNGLSRTSVEAIQSRLRGLNFYSGTVDGIWGGSTAQAIERFQRSRGLQPDGQLNPPTVAALGLDPNAMIPAR